MTKDELITWAKAHGWAEDRYGHFQRTTCMPEGCPREVRTYRLKLSNIAVRYEVKSSAGCYAEYGITPAMPNTGLCRMARGEGRGSCGGHGRRRAKVLLRFGIVRVPRHRLFRYPRSWSPGRYRFSLAPTGVVFLRTSSLSARL